LVNAVRLKYDYQRFAVSGIILAVIAGCFPLLFRGPRRQKVRASTAQARLVAVLSPAFISGISQR
jgi:hypothetical protein